MFRKIANIYIGIAVITFVLFTCTKNTSINNTDDVDANITILYTNDEHGWIEKSDYTNGAANMYTLWKENEGYDGDESFLILSGGDNWTGPAISTWFEGESTVEVMNAMQYDASAIGNHEFDFKVDGLYDRIEQANFTYLAANIREKNSGQIPDFATPYIMKDIDGIMVGIIGLANFSTPWSTFPTHVEDFDFISYFTALEEFVPVVKDDGADIIIVVGHLCNSEMTDLAHNLIEWGVSIITGGHCHEGLIGRVVSNAKGQVAIIKASAYMTNYAKVEISYNTKDKEITELKVGGVLNDETTADAAVADVVSYWRTQTDAELSQNVGYTDVEIVRESPEMYNMVTDSWLFMYPDADIAMTNAGGIRQSIPAGEITKETIIGVLPFANHIIELELTGSEVIHCTSYHDMVFGGITIIDGYFLSDGTSIEHNTTYTVLTTDYLYSRNDSRFPFSQYDSNPYYTSLNYHQPTIDWISSLNTSSTNPLSNYLDYTARC